jgi:hypothetical protein
LNEAEVAKAVSSAKAADRAIALIEQLLGELQALHAKDGASGNALLEAALSIANGDQRSPSTESLSSLSLSLAQSAKLSPKLTLRGMAAALSSSQVHLPLPSSPPNK